MTAAEARALEAEAERPYTEHLKTCATCLAANARGCFGPGFCDQASKLRKSPNEGRVAIVKRFFSPR